MVTGQLIFEENGSRSVNGSWAIGYWASFSRLDRQGNELNKNQKKNKKNRTCGVGPKSPTSARNGLNWAPPLEMMNVQHKLGLSLRPLLLLMFYLIILIKKVSLLY